MSARLVQISISRGGMPKRPIPTARVTAKGVEGDWQKTRKYHGGRDRAICLYSEELYNWLREQGIDLQPGAVGENFTTRGLDLQSLAKGDRLKVGECVIEITSSRVPCRQLLQWHADLPRRILGHSGWMAKVIVEGEVRQGDACIRCISRYTHGFH